jgi:hypothetical protein
MSQVRLDYPQELVFIWPDSRVENKVVPQSNRMPAGVVQTGRHDFSATLDFIDARKSIFRNCLYAWLRQALVLN